MNSKDWTEAVLIAANLASIMVHEPNWFTVFGIAGALTIYMARIIRLSQEGEC